MAMKWVGDRLELIPSVREARQANRRSVAEAWKSDSKGPPPHELKELIVLAYSDPKFTLFIESGTYYGDMVQAVKGHFDRVISIEVDPPLASIARLRFLTSRRVLILQGDSGSLLPEVLSDESARCVFWLDGHYSGGVTAKGEDVTPVVRELNAIMKNADGQHIILIDDAREFGKDPSYPLLIDIERIARAHGYDFSVEWDVIQLTPRLNVTPTASK
jgi:hypothetical protein